MRRFVVLICSLLMAAVALPLAPVSVAGAQAPEHVLGPEIMHTTTCLAGNGRVDTNIVNTKPGAAAYRIEFQGLSPRQRTVTSLDWWRQPITGRPDGRHQIVVKRDGVVVSDRIVVVDCDSDSPSVTSSEVQVVNSCRAGRGYILFQFANPRPQRQGYVVIFEGVSNRSTSAAAYGGAVRAVTGRQAGSYTYSIRDSASQTVFATGDVVVDCANPPAPEPGPGEGQVLNQRPIAAPSFAPNVIPIPATQPAAVIAAPGPLAPSDLVVGGASSWGALGQLAGRSAGGDVSIAQAIEVIDAPLPSVAGSSLTSVQLRVEDPGQVSENPNAPIRNDSADGRVTFHGPSLVQTGPGSRGLPAGEICVWYRIRRGSQAVVPPEPSAGLNALWRQTTCIPLGGLQLFPGVDVPFDSDFDVAIDTRVAGVGLSVGGAVVEFQPVYFEGGYASGSTGVRMGSVARSTGTEVTADIDVLGPDSTDDINGPNQVPSGETAQFSVPPQIGVTQWAVVPARSGDDIQAASCGLTEYLVAGTATAMSYSFSDPGLYVICANTAPIPQRNWLIKTVRVGGADVLGLAGLGDSPAIVAGVHTASGNWTVSRRDAGLEGAGPALVVDRVYNSTVTRSGPFGTGWSFNYDTTVTLTEDSSAQNLASYYLTRWDGGLQRFNFEQQTGSSRLYSSGGSNPSLLTRFGDGRFRLDNRDGSALTFLSTGRLETMLDAAGNRTDLGYVGAELRTVTDAQSGRRLNFGWTGNVITSVSAVAPDGNGESVWEYDYETATVAGVSYQVLLRACDPTGVCESYGWKQAAEINASQPACIGTRPAICAIYNGENRLSESVDYLQPINRFGGKVDTHRLVPAANQTNVTRFAYGGSPFANPFTTTVTDPAGNSWDYGFDDRARHVRLEPPVGGATTFDFDGDGNRIASTVGAGTVDAATTRYSHDDAGYVRSMTDPTGVVTNYIVASDGRLLAECDHSVAGGVSNQQRCNTYTYDTNPQYKFLIARSTAPIDGVQVETDERTYVAVGQNGAGQVLTETINGLTTTYGYNSAGDLRSVTTPQGSRTEFTYNNWGQVETVKEFSKANGFPAAGVVMASYTYDDAGRILTLTGASVQNEIANANRQAVTSNRYDNNGELAQVDIIGESTTRRTVREFDRVGREITAVLADGATLTTRYDSRGNVLEVNDAGIRERSVHGPLNEVDERCLARNTAVTCSGQTMLFKVNGRDGRGNITRMTEYISDTDTRVLVNTFDLADRALTVGIENFDDDGDDSPGAVRRVSESSYDPLTGRLTKLREGGVLGTTNAARERVTDYRYFLNAYSDAIRDTKVQLGNGEVQTVAYGYDTYGEVSRETLTRTPATSGPLVAVPRPAGTAMTSTTTINRAYQRSLPAGAGADLGQTGHRISIVTVTTSSVDLDGSTGNAATNVTTETAFDDRGLLLYEDDANGNRTFHKNDVLGRTLEVTSPRADANTLGPSASHVTRLGYNTFGDVTHQSASDRSRTLFAHDNLGRVIFARYPRVNLPISGSSLTPTESWTYDERGHLESTTSRRGYTTTYLYDDFGYLESETQPQGWGTYRYVRDYIGNVLQERAPSGAVTNYRYDDFDRQVRVEQVVRAKTLLDGSSVPSSRPVTEILYDDFGSVASITDPEGRTSQFTSNALGEPRTATTPNADETVTFVNNHLGQTIAARSSKFEWTDQTVANRLGMTLETKRRTKAGTTVLRSTFAYAPTGNVIEATNANDHTTEYGYDQRNRLIEVKVPVSSSQFATTRYGYNRAGDLTAIVDAESNRTDRTYNFWGLLETTVEPGSEAASLRTFTDEYDRGGLLTHYQQPGEEPVRRLYDELGRLVVEGEFDNGGWRSRWSIFRFDSADQPVSAAQTPAGVQNFVYDDRALMLESDGPLGRSEMTWHRDGRLKTRVDPAAFDRSDPHTFDYDGNGRLRSHRDPIADATTTYTWEVPAVNGSRFRNTSTRGDVVRRVSLTTDTGRVFEDRLTRSSGGSTEQLYLAEYEYDALGNIEQETVRATEGSAERTPEVHTYTYDEANRLKTWQTVAETAGGNIATIDGVGANRFTTYTYDKVGNRTRAVTTGGVTETKSWSYDDRNRLETGPDGTSYDYDARGALIKIDRPGSDEDTTYNYDPVGRLTSLQHGDNTATYDHDSFGRLAFQSNVVGGFKYSGFDGDPTVVGEERYGRDSSGALTSMRRGSAQPVSIIANLHGDIRATTSVDDGEVDFLITTDPWGDEFWSTGRDGSDPSLGFQGDWEDPVTGDLKTDTRWYSPSTGAFTSRDVFNGDVTRPPTMNRYLYAASNPTMYADRSGLDYDLDCMCYIHTASGQKFDDNPEVVARFKEKEAKRELNKANEQAYSAADLGSMGGGSGGVEQDSPTAEKASGETDQQTDDLVLATAPVQEIPVPDELQAAEEPTFEEQFEWCLENCSEAEKTAFADMLVAMNYDMFDVGKYNDDGHDGNISGDDFEAIRDNRHGNASEMAQWAAGYLLDQGEHEKYKTQTSLWDKVVDVASVAVEFVPFYDCFAAARDVIKGDVGGGTALAVGGCAADFVGAGVFADIGKAAARGVDAARTASNSSDAGRMLENVGGLCKRMNSFSGDTRVLMADGSHVAFEDLDFGDEVWALDPETGESGGRDVVGIWPHIDDVFEIEVADGTVVVTEDHPFWNATDRVWEGLVDFDVDDQVLTVGGELADVGEIDFASVSTTTAWDITVDDLHTFYVQIGDADVLVHNTNGPNEACGVPGGLPPLRQQYVDAVAEIGDTVSAMRAAGASAEDIARTAHAQRRELGVRFKDLTPEPLRTEIYERNLAKYGDRLGPTIELLREKNKTWEQIIESASRTGGKDLGF